MSVDRNGLEVLTPEECMDLLGGAVIGRVALTVGALPVVVPVNFAVLDGDIVFRTARGAKLEAALHNAVVAFEVDEADPIYHTGWSVLVTGVARLVTDPDELARVEHLPLRPWAHGDQSYVVRLSGDLISGRRLGAGDPVLVEPGPAPVQALS